MPGDPLAKCPSCGIPYEQHMGLIGTCRKLETLRRRVNEFQRTFNLTPSQCERIKEMLKESDE